MTTSKSSISHGTVRIAASIPRPQSPLVSSPTMAKREAAKLRKGRERLESEPSVAEIVVRSALI